MKDEKKSELTNETYLHYCSEYANANFFKNKLNIPEFKAEASDYDGYIEPNDGDEDDQQYRQLEGNKVYNIDKLPKEKTRYSSE